jgi:hypothetical protein
MNPRLATIATWCREMVIPASVLTGLAVFGSVRINDTGATPFVNRLAPALRAEARFADNTPTDKDRADSSRANTKLADAPQSVAADNAGSVIIGSIAVKDASAEVTPALHHADPAPAAQEAEAKTEQPIVTASLGDPAETLSSEAPDQASAPEAAAEPANPQTGVAKDRFDTTEILDECYVIDVCVDRYLWALYQRTPKEDSVKEQSQKQVTVKRKGKTVTVTRTVSAIVDEDFAWKDRKAAEHAEMSMMDYVMGGVDRDFKLRLFHMLRAAEAAGLSPGITSAFRDDYRQSIASGRQRQVLSWRQLPRRLWSRARG